LKSKTLAYFLWIVGFFGLLGFHRFYLGKIATGLLWFITFGLFGIGAFIDLFTLGSQVEQHNTSLELKTLRNLANESAKIALIEGTMRLPVK
jgi:hypothetical protein